MRLYLLLGVLWSVASHVAVVQAQASYDEDLMLNKLVPGYIITSTTDTIEGKVKVGTRSRNQVKIRFYDREGRSKVYRSRDLLGYGYQTRENNNNANYVVKRWRHYLRKEAEQPPVPFGPREVWMEVKASGRAILYSYYIQDNNNVRNQYTHYYYLEFKDGSRERKISKNDFEWVVPAFLEDCPKIDGIVGTRMGFANLEEIVKIYNNCEKYGLDGKCGECELEQMAEEAAQ